MSKTSWRTPLVVLACGCLIMTISFGIRAGFGLFLQPISLEHGWGREVFSFAIALQNLMWGALGAVAGGVGVTVLPATSTAASGGASDLIRILPFARPAPPRRVVLAWRRSFPRPEAIEALRKSILACNLPQVEKLNS